VRRSCACGALHGEQGGGAGCGCDIQNRTAVHIHLHSPRVGRRLLRYLVEEADHLADPLALHGDDGRENLRAAFRVGLGLDGGRKPR
jgi:hypothetical protein